MSKSTEAATWILGIAVDDSHGYQWGGWGPEYDCGHLVIMAYEAVGVHVREAGATYTGNMRQAFLACGFEDVISQVNLATGAGLQIGDALVNEANHAAMYVGNGCIVQARSNFDGIAGDSSGQEIREQAYYNYPWDCVFRLKENGAPGSSSTDMITPFMPAAPESGEDQGKYPTLRITSKGDAVKRMQELLIKTGANLGPRGADGDFGGYTYAAVVEFQIRHNLEADGIVGPLTWAALEQAAAAAPSAETTAPAEQEKPADPVETSEDGYTIYTVQRGDTLWGIASKHLGSGTRWTEIKKLNELKTIIIHQGQKLKLPKK